MSILPKNWVILQKLCNDRRDLLRNLRSYLYTMRLEKKNMLHDVTDL